MISGVVSSKVIVIVKLAVPTFPAASVAVQVTVVVPIGNNEPAAGEQVGPEATPTMSDAVTVNGIVLPAGLEVEFDMLVRNTATTGGVVSVESGSAGTVTDEVPDGSPVAI